METRTTEASAMVELDGMRLHYRELGAGPPVLLLHGWPTSSFLWRNVMPAIAEHNRVIALDLPGFGESSKPLDASYSFGFHRRALDGFADALGVEELSIAVHDLGGPIGLHWVVRNPKRIRKLALLNTLVYPRMSWAVVVFVAACRTPGVRSALASPSGLRFAMRFGLADKSNATDEMLAGVLAPFQTNDARKALLKTAYGLQPGGFKEIADKLPSLDVPVRLIYGEKDRILPDVAKTMRNVKRDIPHAELTALPGCGHFLQEEQPQRVGELLAEFFAD